MAEEETRLFTSENKNYSSENSIVFHRIHYSVSEGICERSRKTILNDVSGTMSPGLNVIMGPTGGGKTSLLDILAGRKNRKGLQGTVLVNGEVQPRNFKCISGYVVQDDVVMGTLTVKENLYFSAALRLSNSISWRDKKQRVKKVIDELGLNSCCDTKVGDEFFRGVSGGERKRTNIGMELIIEPEVLFLDEPTTGLDAFTAVAIVQLLKHLSSDGRRIIIMSIHQPRYSIYKLFDTLTLLSKGEMVYQGKTSNCLDYFSSLGFNCEEHDNPADFLLDVINLCERENTVAHSDLELGNGGAVNLPASYNQSQEKRSTVADCERALDSSRYSAAGETNYSIFSGSKYATNMLWQLLIVYIRSTVNLVRSPMTSILQYIIVVILGVIVGAVYWQLDTGQNGYQNRVGAIFFIVLNQVFSNLSAIDLFVKQKALFIHENVSGYYRVSIYFVAKVTCDLLSTRLFPLCFFSLIVYFMIGFQIDIEKFFIFFLTLFLTAFSASALTFWVSAGVKVAGIGNLLVALTFVFQMLFGGFLLTLDSLPVYLRWLQYLSIFRYSIEALIVNEVDGLQFNQTINGESLLVNGTDILKLQGFEVDWLWYDQIGLAGLCVLFLALGYVTLRAIKKDK